MIGRLHMATLLKRATVYLDPDLHKALKLKAAEISASISDLINLAVKSSLVEDAEDLAAFTERKHEPLISFEQILKDLKANGKL